jgi:septum formation protein
MRSVPGIGRGPRKSPPLVLASTSPRRTAILHMLGLAHEVLPGGVPEDQRPGETPQAHVERLAREKALRGKSERPDALVLAGDTVVVLGGEMLGKPKTPDAAVTMLLALSGRAHVVHSALALVEPGGSMHSIVSSTRVTFHAFDDEAARAYVATGEPLDKAGAYGIQGRGAALVSRIDGDYYTVVGLPMAGLMTLLERAGWRYAFGGLVQTAHASVREPHPSQRESSSS